MKASASTNAPRAACPIVTGGGGGIGSAICQRLGEEGAQVAIFDLDGAGAERVAAGIRDAGGRARAWAVDITDQARVVAAVAEVESALGPVDVLGRVGPDGCRDRSSYACCSGSSASRRGIDNDSRSQCALLVPHTEGVRCHHGNRSNRSIS